jgi:uncharacterized membrane protein
MNLPDISIPDIPIIESISFANFSHPLAVHFAIALPLVIVLLEFINLFARRKLLGSVSFIFMILFSITVFGAYITGVTDSKLLMDSVSEEILPIYQQHRVDGIYLVYGSIVLIAIKLLSVVVRKMGVRILFILFLLVYGAILLNVALRGTDLIYKYGVVCPNVTTSSKVKKKSVTDKRRGNGTENIEKDTPKAMKIERDREALKIDSNGSKSKSELKSGTDVNVDVDVDGNDKNSKNKKERDNNRT